VGVADPYASAQKVRLESPGGEWHALDDGSTNGTWVNDQRLSPREGWRLRDGDIVQVGHTFFLFRASVVAAPGLGDEGSSETLRPEWQLELARLERLARGAHPVLIEGETGSGKEVLAQALHRWSGRRTLVAVNCGALAESLLEDELFGHVRGAFSGAQGERQGLIRAADGGTLLLDELGEMPLSLQVKLLRVLETKTVRPIGSEREIAVDVRVIAATHRSLRELVAQGRFRADLLSRLGLLSVRVPPLRERREDLGLIIRALLRALVTDLSQLSFSPEALRLLLLHRWPLNVRELRSALQVSLELARGDGLGKTTIGLEHLPSGIREPRPASLLDSALDERQQPKRELRAEELALRAQLIEALRRFDGNVSAVAREMAKGRTQIQRWIARFAIDVEAVRAGKQV
jgi:transcriptional regulator with PAS, ATPase and Fis domain